MVKRLSVDTMQKLNIGILALQGAYDLHIDVLRKIEMRDESQIGIEVQLVKKPEDLEKIDGIILPGGESTVMQKLLVTSGVDSAIREKIATGLPVFGTCAGLILLANYFSVLDCVVERNSYGSQINSFETDVECVPLAKTCRAFFIRAPKILSVRENAEVFARCGDDVVGVSHDAVMGISCHPEVPGSLLFHEFFVNKIRERVKSLS